nr:protein ripply1 isoform X4 [Kogia breviceps]
MSPGRPYKRVSQEKPKECGRFGEIGGPHSLPDRDTLRMDPAACGPAPASAPALARGPLALPGLGNPSPLLSFGQEVDRSERGACLWRPWLSSTNDLPRQVRKPVDLAAGGATGAEVTKVDSEFHHPVSDGEILLQNFPVQATINLYEDSASEEEDDEEEEGKEQEEEEADEKGPEGCVKAPWPAAHRASAPPPSLLLTCPN